MLTEKFRLQCEQALVRALAEREALNDQIAGLKKILRIKDQPSTPSEGSARARILAHFEKHGAASVTDLHRDLGVKRSTISSALNQLKTQGRVSSVRRGVWEIAK